MIDGKQSHLVQVVELLHRLQHAEQNPAILWGDVRTRNLEVLVGIGNVAFVRPDPMSDDSRTDHVREKLELPPIPNEHDWTRASTPVDFGDLASLSAATCNSSCGTPVGQRRRTTSGAASVPRPVRMSVGPWPR